jgi:hypothetical protein
MVVAAAILSVSSLAAQPRLQLVEELRLDPNKETFSVIGKVLVAPNGAIVVPQPQERKLLFFAADGRRLGEFGRRGGGPDEFPGAFTAMGWTGDTLWVAVGGRITMISPSRTVLRSMTATSGLPANATLPRVGRLDPLAIYSDRSYLALPAIGPPFPPGFDTTSVAFIRVSPLGGGRIVARLPLGPPETTAKHYPTQRPRVAPDPSHLPAAPPPKDPPLTLGLPVPRSVIPFYPVPVEAVSADGSRIAVVTTRMTSPRAGNFRLTLLRETGDTIYSRTYPFTGVPTPRAMAESEVRTAVGFFRLAPDAEAEMLRRIPEVEPPVDMIVIGRDGVAWVGPYARGREHTWLALDERGEPIGRITLPPRTSISAVSRTHIWVTEKDADDLESVVRYRVAVAP